MNDYQREQHTALNLAAGYLESLPAKAIDALRIEIRDYLAYRGEVERFLRLHCGKICSQSCYTSKTSACCSKDGIITFWADVLINAISATKIQQATLFKRIQHPHYNDKCIYLTAKGCAWQVRPLVCAMFLCDRVQQEVLANDTTANNQWQTLQNHAKSYRWPDKPVLFDTLEQRSMEAGIHSPLMYLNNSPGLLQVKKKAGLT